MQSRHLWALQHAGLVFDIFSVGASELQFSLREPFPAPPSATFALPVLVFPAMLYRR